MIVRSIISIFFFRVPADFRSLVYFYGVYFGGKEEWDFVFDRYMKNKIASEKTKLMYALSAVKEPWIINRYDPPYISFNEEMISEGLRQVNIQ